MLKGPIKDAIAKLITAENFGKLLALIISLMQQKSVEPLLQSDPATAELRTALASVPADQQGALLAECCEELIAEGKI